MDDEVLIARVYIHDADHGRRKSLMPVVLNILHDQRRLEGVAVFRAIAGLGESSEVRAADILRRNVDLPPVIEFFDRPEVVRAALALLDPLLPAGRILSWPATRRCSVARRWLIKSQRNLRDWADDTAIDRRQSSPSSGG
ncbi:MAG: DUF190 domain-containing protein [Rhodospirillales bacterium]|nr:DUF190 domain-containing protein [Rhodospirillales bacterium]